MEQQRILLLGLGFWGTNWIGTLGRAANCAIAGIAGCEEDIARVADEHGIAPDQACTDYREAIDKTDADIVIIANTASPWSARPRSRWPGERGWNCETGCGNTRRSIKETLCLRR